MKTRFYLFINLAFYCTALPLSSAPFDFLHKVTLGLLTLAALPKNLPSNAATELNTTPSNIPKPLILHTQEDYLLTTTYHENPYSKAQKLYVNLYNASGILTSKKAFLELNDQTLHALTPTYEQDIACLISTQHPHTAQDQVIQYDHDLRFLWAETLPQGFCDQACDLRALPDKLILTSFSPKTPTSILQVVHMHHPHTVTWKKHFHTHLGNLKSTFAISSDASIFLAFRTQANVYTITKFDHQGFLCWEKTLSSPNPCSIQQILPTQKGNLIITGGTSNTHHAAAHCMVGHINTSPQLTWAKVLQTPFPCTCYSSIITRNHDIVVTGVSYWTTSLPFVARFSQQGRLLWAKVFHQTMLSSQLFETAQGYLMVIGHPPLHPRNHTLIAQVEANGSGTGTFISFPCQEITSSILWQDADPQSTFISTEKIQPTHLMEKHRRSHRRLQVSTTPLSSSLPTISPSSHPTSSPTQKPKKDETYQKTFMALAIFIYAVLTSIGCYLTYKKNHPTLPLENNKITFRQQETLYA